MINNLAKSGKSAFGQFKMNFSRKTELRNLKRITKNLELNRLTSSEAAEARMYWNRLPVKLNLAEFDVFKTLSGFDKRFVPIDLYYPYIKKSLNPDKYTFALGHKALFNNIYANFPQPETIVLRIRGTYFDKDRHIINKASALEIIKSIDRCIIKPTIDTKCGKGVKMFSPTDRDFEHLLDEHGEDFIVQEVLEQSSQTSRFNPHSLNTFRVTSLFINGEVSICAISLKCAQGDHIVDNLRAGGLMISVDEDGQFHNFALDHSFQKHFTTADGQDYFSFKIPEVKDIVTMIKEQHPLVLPNLGIVGWDIALDCNNKPVLIEPNVWYPGIQYSQHCAQRPIFGERTDEVIDYVLAHPPVLY